MCHPETTSQSERGFWDVLSAWAAIGKARPGLRCQGVFFTPAPCIEFDSPRFGACVGAGHGQLKFDKHHICFGLGHCAENPRICFANPHRLRPPVGVLARSLQTLRVCLTLAPCAEFDSPRFGACVGAGHGQLKFDKHHICFGLGHCAENPRICFANPHRLRPPVGVLARSLQTLRVCLTLAPCAEFDSPRYGLEIKRQVETLLYLPVTIGGGAENRTPVHESPLIGISKLSRWFSLGRFARSDTLAAS